jgi:hypothetical protein
MDLDFIMGPLRSLPGTPDYGLAVVVGWILGWASTAFSRARRVRVAEATAERYGYQYEQLLRELHATAWASPPVARKRPRA